MYGNTITIMEMAAREGVERREYPRIQTNCPVRYRVNGTDEWLNGTLLDYSATGALIQCEELLLKDTQLQIVVMRSNSKNVPNFSAEGVVVRFTLDEDHLFQIGCKFNNAIRTLINSAEQ